MRKNIYILFSICLLQSCVQENKQLAEQQFKGKTMGTTYTIKYVGAEIQSLQSEIDTLLTALNQSVSTYIPTSTISKVNQNGVGEIKVDDYFMDNFIESKKIHKATNGGYNPAIMPLVNYWGFGYERLQHREIDSMKVEELTEICDFSNFSLEGNMLTKHNPNAELDFSAIAKGYGVDLVSEYLLNRNIKHFLIEIGGETRANGLNAKLMPWTIGIRKPSADREQFHFIIETVHLNNHALATSGNYENYLELANKEVIAHTINPETGYPQTLEEEILSSTVLADKCSTADAYATAFKVIGFRKSLEVLKREKNLEAFFVYMNDSGEISTYATRKFKQNE